MRTTTTAVPGQATLLACWTTLARLSPRARVLDMRNAAVAVFPAAEFLNNAVLTDVSAAVAVSSEVAALYADAGVGSWALWVPSQEIAFNRPDHLSSVGELRRDVTTLVMHADLQSDLSSDPRVVRGSYAAIERLALTDEPITLADLGEPDEIDGLAAWALVEDGMAVSSAYMFRDDDDCGVYSVGTVPGWRRRGLARALVAHALADARDRGARTASLQSTQMGRALYEMLGFHAVGRYEEWVSSRAD